MKKILPIIAGMALGIAFGTSSFAIMSNYISKSNTITVPDSSSILAVNANADITTSKITTESTNTDSSQSEVTTASTTSTAKTTSGTTAQTTTKSKISVSTVTTSRNNTSNSTNNNDKSIADGSRIGTAQPTGEKVVYLTFDDGPSDLTPQVLDILDRYKVKATFFVTGFDTKNSKYIKAAHDKGHTIGMHTYSHNYAYIYSSVENYYKDLNRIAELCKQQLGYVPHYIRFPGGSSNTISSNYKKGIMKQLTNDIHKHGYQYYDWNSANNDAMGGTPTAEYLYQSAISFAGQSDLVMLCHDSKDKAATVQALPRIIEYYQKQGYIFRGIDDKSYVAHHQVNN